MSKYIIDVGDAYVRHALGRKLIIPVIINNNTEYWVNTNIQLTPYTEPDMEKIREEAHENGYKTAKVQCNIQAEKDLREVGERHYQKGLSDAWEAARKIAISEESGGLTCREMQRIFCTDETDEIFDMSASEAIERIHQYEQEKEEIKVGDEVIFDGGKYVVLVVDEDGIPEKLLESDGYTLTLTTDTRPQKTGRHFPEIAAVLRKMKEES